MEISKLGSRQSAVFRITLALIPFWSFATVSRPSSADAPTAPSLQEAAAPAPVSIELSHEEEGRFSTFLSAFTQRAHMVLIAEGEPLRHSLTDDELLNLPVKGTAVDILDAVALAYDYRVVRGKPRGTVYLLEKQYSDPTDVPSITIEEAVGAIKDAERLVGQFDPNIGIFPTPLVQSLYGDLTPDQIGTMLAPGGGLPVEQLTADQQADLHRIIEFSYTSRTAFQTEQVLGQVTDLQNKRATVGWSTSIKGLRLFGYKPHGPLEIRTVNDFRPLSDPAVFANIIGYGAVWSALGPMVLQADDPTDPDKRSDTLRRSPNAAAAATPETPLAVSLRDAIAALQQPPSSAVADRAGTSSKQAPPTMEVADSLAAKTVIVANPSAATADDVARGIATLYGLSIRTDSSNGATRLDRRRIVKLDRLSDLQPALLDVLPTPFLRAIHWEAKEARDRGIVDLNDRLQLLNRQATMGGDPSLSNDAAVRQAAVGRELMETVSRLGDLQKPDSNHGSADKSLRNGVVKRLRTDVEPLLAHSKTDMISLATLNDESHFALASVLLTDLYAALSGRVAALPRFVTYKDRLVLRAVNGQFMVPESNGTMRAGLRITLYYRDSDGGIVQAGASYIAFPDGANGPIQVPEPSL